MQDKVWIRPAKTTVCDVHFWSRDPGLPARLFQAMRDKHGNGGVNVCRECLTEIRNIAAKNAGIETS